MKTYRTWADRYMAIFGLGTDADAAMVDSWYEVFQSAGFQIEELEEATDWIAANAGPMNRPEHRPAIQDRVRRRRAERWQAELSQLDRVPGISCPLCNGPGLVVVPLLASLTDGVWDGAGTAGQRYTCTVSCRCPRGEALAATYRLPELEKSTANRNRPVLLRLVDYERVNPEWFQQMRLRQREQQAAVVADTLADAAERARPLAKTIERIMARERK